LPQFNDGEIRHRVAPDQICLDLVSTAQKCTYPGPQAVNDMMVRYDMTCRIDDEPGPEDRIHGRGDAA
jgi:hypothetical protein